ncbi:hypothetical protein, partial [Novosphingobium sp.]|uniref:hypothetical protein n=1 Tax=Novosphingobium sp. TaxID=1874826 RepID=UPI002FD9C1E9
PRVPLNSSAQAKTEAQSPQSRSIDRSEHAVEALVRGGAVACRPGIARDVLAINPMACCVPSGIA